MKDIIQVNTKTRQVREVQLLFKIEIKNWKIEREVVTEKYEMLMLLTVIP